MPEEGLCRKCKTTITVAHNGGQWCPTCGAFSTPPDWQKREPDPIAEPSPGPTPIALNIASAAILIGYDAEGACVYSDLRELGDYYDGEHVWDTSEGVQQLRLQRVKVYLFDDGGALYQEAETIFDPDTGLLQSDSIRHRDGTTQSYSGAA